MKRSQLLFTICLYTLITCHIHAQPFFQWDDGIPVKISGNTLTNAWAGGLNFIQASTIDLNSDGIPDLFIFDRTGNKIRTFINNGTDGVVDYKYAPQYESKFPHLHDWALLADYNGDSKADIFSYSDLGGGFDVYKNISTVSEGLKFQRVQKQVRSMYNPPSTTAYNLYISPVDIPAITDIDDDGDLDIVTFAITGTFMEYHKNMSMELYGTADSLKYQMGNRCWGYAAEDAFTNKFILHDTAGGPNVPFPELIADTSGTRTAERHSGACEICIDLDNDADKEIIVGGISYNNLTMVTNGGTIHSSNMIAVDTAFPSNNPVGTPAIDLTVFPCAYYLDVNSDGAKDLIVSPNSPNASENFNSVVYYKNNGTSNFPVFQYQQSNMLQDNMIDLGEGAYPVFFDYNNDGLKDLFIGNYGYFDTSGFQHKIALFKNTGTTTVPKFELITRDYDGYDGSTTALSTLGISNMVPAFGDMDGDGISDMILGGETGKLYYFRNIATSGTMAHFVLTAAELKNSNGRIIDVGDAATPQIVDVDNDGKNDIVIGSRNGKLAYYSHIGSATAAIPVLDSISHFWGNIKVTEFGYFTGYSYPFLFKDAGISKLLVGEESGYLRLYNNIDGNLTGPFTLIDSTYMDIWQGTRTSPFGADINNDGYMDLIVGNYQGGVSFYKGVGTLSTIESNDIHHFNINLFPNPANDNITLKIMNDYLAEYIVDLYNMMGQLIISQKTSSNSLSINTQKLSQGIYICKVSEVTNSGTGQTQTLIKRIAVQH